MNERMEASAPRRPPRSAAVFAAQAGLLVRHFRWVPAVLVVIGSLLLFEWVVLPEPVPRFYVVFPALLFLSLFWSGVVWHDEGPARRGYHWSLPVGRVRHDMTRLLVGALGLLAVFSLLIVLGIAFAAADGQLAFVLDAPASFWANVLLAPLIAYLITSALAIGTNRPGLWLIVVLAAYLALVALASRLGLEAIVAGLEAVVDGRYGLARALTAGFIDGISRVAGEPARYADASWYLAVALWLALLTGLCAAVSAVHPDRLRPGILRLRSRPAGR